MTVGLAALCNTEDGPKVVLAADRMVTTGVAARIEYEHTNSKIVQLDTPDGMNAMAVAAGSMSLADDFFYELNNYLRRETINDLREVATYGVDSFHDLMHETVNRQILKPVGLDLEDLSNRQNQMNQQILQSLYQDVLQKEDEIKQRLNILIAGVGQSGGHIYSVQNSDMARFDSIGYHAIGSGTQPARSSFIRNRYDTDCSIEDGLFATVDAKMQAEEAQGVGQRMDIVVLSDDGRTMLDQESIDSLRDVQESVSTEQKEARESVISEADYAFNPEA